MSNTEITVIVQGDGTVRARNQDGAEVSGKVEFDRWHQDLIGIFGDWLNQSKISKRRELEAFGALLYRTLFGGEVGDFFERTLANLRSGGRLRVQLSFQEEAFALARLPWEYLYRPDTETSPGFFLSTHIELVFSRYMPLSTGRQSLITTEHPLRILIVVSQPEDLGPVVAEQVIEAIERLGDVKVDILDNPTVDNFLDTLRETQPHVLHFIGHGRFDLKERQGEIALLGPDERIVRWVRDRDFTEYFVNMHARPRLVVLHLCESGVVDFNANFAGLAPQLILAGIPAVVAMQYPITNQAAISFCRNFYRELAKGEPIDQAVQYGRWRITTDIENAYDTRVFGTPALYMHSRDGIIRPQANIPVNA